MQDLAEVGWADWDRDGLPLAGWQREFHPAALPLWMPFVDQTASWLGRTDSVGVEMVQAHIVRGASGLGLVPSCPFDCMAQIGETDMVEVHPGYWVHTCWYYCTSEVAARALVDTDPWTDGH